MFMKGEMSIVMSPQYFRSDIVQDVDSSDSNCCLLYFNANITYSFTKKASASGGLRPQDPLPGLRPWTPLGSPDNVFFYVLPNNPVRSTPLCVVVGTVSISAGVCFTTIICQGMALLVHAGYKLGFATHIELCTCLLIIPVSLQCVNSCQDLPTDPSLSNSAQHSFAHSKLS